MPSANLSAIVHAKEEFLRQLDYVVLDVMVEWLLRWYSESRNTREFETKLDEVKAWSDTQIAEFTNDVKNRQSRIEDLISAIYVASVRILTSSSRNGRNTGSNIKVKIPFWRTVIHNIFKSACQIVKYDSSALEAPDHLVHNKMEKVLADNTFNEFRKLLPMGDILNYITSNSANNDDDSSSSSSDFSESDDEKNSKDSKEDKSESSDDEGEGDGEKEIYAGEDAEDDQDAQDVDAQQPPPPPAAPQPPLQPQQPQQPPTPPQFPLQRPVLNPNANF